MKTRNGAAAGQERRHRWLTQLWPGSAVPSAIPALDGLRAVAVALVMSYHAYHPIHGAIRYTSAFDAFSFGDTGVQLFFVLSGFLLCLPYARWLFNLQAQPSALRFYQRRILRVGPAYWVNIIILFLLSGWSVSGLLTLLGRIPYLHNVFSHDLTRHAGVLWTMCVEVQFYVVLPLLTGAMYLAAKWFARFTRNSRLAIILAIALVLVSSEALSALCMQLMTHNRWRSFAFLAIAPDVLFDPNSMPYWLGVFAIGMACSFLYVWVTQAHKQSGEQMRNTRALASVAFVAGALFGLGIALGPLVRLHVPYTDFAFGGVYGLLLIGVTLGANVLRRPFESRALRFIGYISYSLYLWHLIVLEYLEPHFTTLTDPHMHMLVTLALDAAIAIPLAYVSYMLTERPFFSLRQRAREQPALATARAATSPSTPFAVARHETLEHVAKGAEAPAFGPGLAPSYHSLHSQALPRPHSSHQAAQREQSSRPLSSRGRRESGENGVNPAPGGSGSPRSSHYPADWQEEAALLDPTIPRMPQMPRMTTSPSSAPAIDEDINRKHLES